MTDQTEGHAVVQKANALVQGLEWIYDRVARSVAGEFGAGTDKDIDHWIRLASTGAGAVGFVANLGGAILLPVAIPANLISTATIQLSLVAKIIAARGYDATTAESRTMGIACLVGSKATEIVSGAGVKVGERLAQAAINQISGAALTRINQAVGFRLITKAGEQGVVNLTKLIPIAGGLVGGTVDAASTYAVGTVAKQMFPRLSQPAESNEATTSEAPPPSARPRPRSVVPGIKTS